MMEPLAFGELELSILKIVKEAGRATVHDVCTRLKSSRSYTTVMTVMSRLSEKGELQREKLGKQYVYWIAPDKKNPSKSVLKRIQNKVFGGRGAAMVSYLIETDHEMSEEELDEIENMIRNKRKQGKDNG